MSIIRYIGITMRAALLLLILSIVTTPVFGETPELRTLAVNGSVELSTPPDHATFSFELYAKADQADDAIAELRKIANSIRADLKQLGLTDANLSTGWFGSSPEWLYSNSEHPKKIPDGYGARVTITVDLDSLNLLERAMSLVSERKPNSMGEANFSLRNFEKVKEEALRRAILKARDKAEIMAKTSGCALGDVLQIEETTGKSSGGYYTSGFGNAASSYHANEPQDPDVSALAMPKDIKTRASVHVVYKLGGE